MDRAPMSRVEVQREAEKLHTENVLKQREHQKISRKQQTPRVQQSLKQIPLLPSPCLDKRDSQEKGQSRSEKMVSYKSTTSLLSPPSLCPPVLGNLGAARHKFKQQDDSSCLLLKGLAPAQPPSLPPNAAQLSELLGGEQQYSLQLCRFYLT